MNQQQKKKATALVAVERLRNPQMILALKGVLPAGLSVERFVAIAAAEIKSQALSKVEDVNSILLGVFHSAKLGLSLNPHMGEAYLIPFSCKVQKQDPANGQIVTKKEITAQFIPGYKGLIRLARNAGMRDIQPVVVHERDSFDYHEDETGFHFTLKVCPEMNRGKVICVITRATLEDGTISVKPTWIDKLEKVKAAALIKTRNTGPWTTHPEEMMAKTGIRGHCKTLPQSDALATAIRADEMVEEGAPADNTIPSELDGIIDADYQIVNDTGDMSKKPEVSMPVQKQGPSEAQKPKAVRGRPKQTKPGAATEPQRTQNEGQSAIALAGTVDGPRPDGWSDELRDLFSMAGIDDPAGWLFAEYSTVEGGIEAIPANLRDVVKRHLESILEDGSAGA